MKRRRLGSPEPRIDRIDRQLPAPPGSDDTTTPGCLVHSLSESVRTVDAMITSAERLYAEAPSEDGIGGWDDDSNDDYLPRRENHIAHLLDAAKLAARRAIRDIEGLEKLAARGALRGIEDKA